MWGTFESVVGTTTIDILSIIAVETDDINHNFSIYTSNHVFVLPSTEGNQIELTRVSKTRQNYLIMK